MLSAKYLAELFLLYLAHIRAYTLRFSWVKPFLRRRDMPNNSEKAMPFNSESDRHGKAKNKTIYYSNNYLTNIRRGINTGVCFTTSTISNRPFSACSPDSA